MLAFLGKSIYNKKVCVKNGYLIQKSKKMVKLKTEEKMKKNLKKVIAMLGMACMLTSVTACQQKFDAAGYVESYADANYKGEFDKYAELCKVDASEAEKVYDENVESIVTSLAAGMELDDEMKEKYTSLVKELLGKVKYTVEDDVEYKDGEYTVKVKAECLNFVMDTEKAYQLGQDIGKEAAEEYLKEHKKIDQSEYTEFLEKKVVDALYEYYGDLVKNATYDAEETIEITVAKNSDGLYAMSETEASEFDNALIKVAN